MPDHATSTSPAVQTQLDRLWSLSPGADILGLDRIARLLERLDDPHLVLPPVFHVAGTNGKGSTCAFLRAAMEAAGHDVHVYSSPHLVRFNERIRIAGRLIEDHALATLLAEVLDQASGIGASFFEVTTAAAFLAFARTPAAATIVEVGLGGRLDATNVVRPTVSGIAALGMDHEAFLGNTLVAIASEKAGIAKPGVPLVTMDYAAPIRSRIAAVAEAAGAPVFARGAAWTTNMAGGMLRYSDPVSAVTVRRPTLVGPHQSRNLGLAIAMLRHQQTVTVPDAAIAVAAETTRWPARMQQLAAGPLVDRLPPGSRIWIDGAHNPNAAGPVSRALRGLAGSRPVVLVIGMLANKDAEGVLRLLVPAVDRVVAVPVPDHDHHSPDALAQQARSLGIAATTASDVTTAIDRVTDGGRPVTMLIAGSLYLAGDVLAANDELPN